MNYDEALNANREDALTLGVAGNSVPAQRERAALAARFRHEWATRVDAIYAGAQPPEEPQVRAPFALWLVDRERGDLSRVIESSELIEALRDDLGYQADHELRRIQSALEGHFHADH